MRHQQLIEHFRKHLAKLQEGRDQRQGTIQWPLESRPRWSATTCAWHKHEMEGLWMEVNRMRLERGHEPITMDELRILEAQAEGHSDYSSKLALYSAELVQGIGPERIQP